MRRYPLHPLPGEKKAGYVKPAPQQRDSDMWADRPIPAAGYRAGEAGQSIENAASRGRLPSVDATLPPTPMRDLIAAASAEIFVFSLDSELVASVRSAGGEHYPIRTVGNWSALVEVVAEGRAHIVLLDADNAPSAIEDCLAELAGLTSILVPVVAAPREAAESLMALLAAGKVHRLLIKPADHGITGLLLESAVGRYFQMRDGADEDIGPDGVVDAPVERASVELVPSRRRKRRRRRRGIGWVGGSMVIAAFGVAALVVMGQFEAGGPEPGRLAANASRTADFPAEAEFEESATFSAITGSEGSAGAATTAATETATAPAIDATRVADAPAANAAGLVTGTGLVTGADPVTASDADVATAAVLSTARAADEAPGAQRLEPASGRPSHPDRPDHPDSEASPLSLLDTVVEADARSLNGPVLTQTPDDAATVVALTHPELPRLLTLLDAHLAEGRLLEPLNDSALGLFERAFALDPYAPQLLARRTALAEALLDSAHAALEQDDLPGASVRAEEAFRLGADRNLLAALDRELESARRAQREVAQRAAEAATAAQAAAAREAAEARERLQAAFLATPAAPGELQLIESAPLVYPPEAERLGIAGWVDLEFIVDTDGDTHEIVVIDSRPGRIFDEAAMRAVEQQRYEPFVLDGDAYARRLKVRMRFELQ